MDARHAVLFEPVVIGPKTLPNRFYQVPHASGFGSVRPWTQAAFRAIKAEGGWGGVCVEYAPIAADTDDTPAIAADIWDEADARALGLTAEAIHAHGALAGLGAVPRRRVRPQRSLAVRADGPEPDRFGTSVGRAG